MPNLLLERYLSGKQREVWQDVVALGTAAQSDFYHKEVKEVAIETMRRARHNVESILQKLDILGYRFSSRDEDVPDLHSMANEANARLAQYREPGFEPRNAREAAMVQMAKMVETMKAQSAQRAPQLAQRREAEEEFRKKHQNKPSIENPSVFEPSTKKILKEIDKLERKIAGPLPMSLRSWYEQVGGVSLAGRHETLNPIDGPQPDVLMTCSFDDSAKFMEVKESDDEEDGIQWLLWAEEGDQFLIQLPDPAADGKILGLDSQPPFVEYLRRAFEWGGFPGWECTSQRPHEELDYLREGLLPL